MKEFCVYYLIASVCTHGVGEAIKSSIFCTITVEIPLIVEG